MQAREAAHVANADVREARHKLDLGPSQKGIKKASLLLSRILGMPNHKHIKRIPKIDQVTVKSGKLETIFHSPQECGNERTILTSRSGKLRTTFTVMSGNEVTSLTSAEGQKLLQLASTRGHWMRAEESPI